MAPGRPGRAGTFADLAMPLFENGYQPIPIRRGEKRPAPNRWSSVEIDEKRIESWCSTFGGCGVGLRTGHLVGVDIDILDPDLAHQVMSLWLQTMVALTAGDTVELQGNFRATDGYFAADQTSFWGTKIG